MSTGADVGQLLLGQEVADLAEVDRVEPVELDEEGGLLAALRALGVVAVRPDAGQQDVADLVLAGPVEDERVVERAREDGLAVARALALGLWQRPVVGMGVRDDLAGDPASGRPDDRLIRVRDDDGIAPAEPDARPAVPAEFHAPDSDTARCTRHALARSDSLRGEARVSSVLLS